MLTLLADPPRRLRHARRHDRIADLAALHPMYRRPLTKSPPSSFRGSWTPGVSARPC
jgi:hypothetical protein